MREKVGVILTDGVADGVADRAGVSAAARCESWARAEVDLVTSTVPLSSNSIHSPVSPSRISTWPGSARTSSMALARMSASSIVMSCSSGDVFSMSGPKVLKCPQWPETFSPASPSCCSSVFISGRGLLAWLARAVREGSAGWPDWPDWSRWFAATVQSQKWQHRQPASRRAHRLAHRRSVQAAPPQ